MPKPIKFSYQKKDAFRDASFFIIVCEGESREKDYFAFFDGLSSRVKVVPVHYPGGSAPKLLPLAAIEKEAELDIDQDRDQVWFVVDTDRWGAQLHELRGECEQRSNWRMVQSNPCFEVWLFFHFHPALPDIANLGRCASWKSHLPTVIAGGFNSDKHPIAIETALANAKSAYQASGYVPQVGSTQLWQLAEVLLPLIKKDLAIAKQQFGNVV